LSVPPAEASVRVPAETRLVEAGKSRLDDKPVAKAVGEEPGQLVAVTPHEGQVIVVVPVVQQGCLEQGSGRSPHIRFGV
jgi:hypothetical protein